MNPPMMVEKAGPRMAKISFAVDGWIKKRIQQSKDHRQNYRAQRARDHHHYTTDNLFQE